LSYEEVDTSIIKPRLRNYAADKEEGTTTEEKKPEKIVVNTSATNGANGAANLGNGDGDKTSASEEIAAGADPTAAGDGGDQLSTRPPAARQDL
ncbi:MAG: hypothetical protein JWQ02_3212, partial [Capsulimonas sp.]|nr:hypothetical protein [Capsulimonas sp.]